MKRKLKTFCGMLPEDLLTVADGSPAGVPIDAITAACSRAEAVLHLLMVQLNSGEDVERLSDHIVANALWDVQGTIGLIRSLAVHGNTTTFRLTKADCV